MSKAIEDVLTERQRQVFDEGWIPEHDEEHSDGELAAAGGCYALHAGMSHSPPLTWPWEAFWWKTKDRRRDLVRAGALIIAEIERLDRAESK